MESSTNQIEKLFQAFGTNLSQENRKSLENTLIEWRRNSINYPLNLLELISKFSNEVQLRAAIEFKLWSKQYFDQQDFENNRYESIIQDIKNLSLQLYLTVNNQCFKQLKEAIAYLCRKQYHQQWQNLPKQLIEVAGQSYEYLIRVLTLFKKITKRYSIQLRTDPLYTQIIFSCDEMHDFLFATCTNLINNLNNNLNQDSLVALKEGLKLFYNLNYQDLHPKFEDNISPWMKILIDAIKMNGDSSNVELFKCKGAALKSIILYSNKYKEDIYDDTIQQFSAEVWNLFNSTSSSNPNLQNLMLEGLKFFRFLVSWSAQKKLYSNSISDLTTTLVLPNIGINQDVKDEFDGETQAFLQCYFQAGDISSKRSYAIDLMKTILRCYPQQFKTFIYNFLQSEAGKQLTVLEECQLYNLVIEVGSSAYRPTQGCTQLNIDESTIKNCYTSILKPRFQVIYQWIIDNPQKQIQLNFQPIQIAMQLRFIYFFRIFIPQQDLSLLLKYCSNLISNHQTLRNIIYMTTQAFITIRHGDFLLQNNLIHYFSPNNVDELAMDILKMLYYNQKKEEKLNSRLCSLFHSLTSIIKQICVKYSEAILNILVSLLQKADQYEFKTILQVFEGFGNFIYWMVDRNQDLTQIQSILHNYLTKLMGIGSDLVNFILQIYAIVLLSKTNVPQIYHSIYGSLIEVSNWSQNNFSLFGSYAFYISSYFKRHPQKIVQDKTKIQQIISALIELKKPNIFFILMNQIYSKFDLQTFYQTGYLKVLMIGIQTMVLNIQEMKTSIFKQSLLFLAKIINNNSPDIVIKIMNQITPGFLENIIVESINIVSTISWREERKPIIIAVSSLLLSNCFTTTAQTQCVMNALIHNTIRRNRFGSLTSRNQLPVQVSFQKLSVFRLIKNNNTTPQETVKMQNEQQYLVNCIQHLINQHGIEGVGALLNQDNQKQLTVLIRKYQQEGQAVI